VSRPFEEAGTCWVPAAARRYKNGSRKVRPQVPLFEFSVVRRFSFCGQVPLGKSSQESWACCGGAEAFPRRLGLGWLINLDSFLADKRLIALVVDHLAKFFQRLPESWRRTCLIIGFEMV